MCGEQLSYEPVRTSPGVVVVFFLLFGIGQSVFAQEACPPPPGYVENPLATPRITAAEVAADPTLENLMAFQSAAEDLFTSVSLFRELEFVHALCLLRQEETGWRSGDMYVMILGGSPRDSTHLRVYVHPVKMGLSGRLIDREIAKDISLAASAEGGGAVPGIGGYVANVGRGFFILVGADIQEQHLEPDVIETHHVPKVSASQVVDRETLKIFVDEAIAYMKSSFQPLGLDGIQAVRSVFRDRNGPWISDSVYIFAVNPVGYVLFHGAFPDEYEYRIMGTVRDVVTGKILSDQIVAAASRSDEGAFVEYFFDDPGDDTDSAEIPKVAYVRQFKYIVAGAGRPIEFSFILGSGIYGAAGSSLGELLFPVMTNVGNHHSTLFLLNPSEFTADGRLEEYSAGAMTDQAYITVDPNSMSSNVRNGDFSDPGEWNRGWGVFTYRFSGDSEADRERLLKQRLLGWTQLVFFDPEKWMGDPTDSVVAVANIPAVQAAPEFRVPGILRSDPEAEVALSILNPSGEPIEAEATLFYHNEEGEQIELRNTLTVPPMDRVSRFLWELMTEGQDDPMERPLGVDRSSLRIRGSAPIGVGALLYYPNGVFGNLPVERVDSE